MWGALSDLTGVTAESLNSFKGKLSEVLLEEDDDGLDPNTPHPDDDAAHDAHDQHAADEPLDEDDDLQGMALYGQPADQEDDEAGAGVSLFESAAGFFSPVKGKAANGSGGDGRGYGDDEVRDGDEAREEVRRLRQELEERDAQYADVTREYNDLLRGKEEELSELRQAVARGGGGGGGGEGDEELGEAREQLRQAEETIRRLRAELASGKEAQGVESTLMERLTAVQEQLSAKHDECFNLEGVLRDERQQRQALAEKLAQSDGQLDALLAKLESTVAAFEEERTLREQIEDHKKALETQYRAQADELDALRERVQGVEQLSEQLEEAKRVGEAYQERCTALEGQLGDGQSAQTQVEELSQKLEEATRVGEAYQERCAALEGQLGDGQSAQTQVEQLSQQLAEAKLQADTSHKRCATLEQQLADAGPLRAQVEQLSQQLEEAKRAGEAYQERCTTLEQQLGDGQSAQTQVEQLSQQLAEAKLQADTSQKRCATLEQQLADAGPLRAQVEQLSQQLEEAKRAGEAYQERCTTLEQQLTDAEPLRAQVEALSQQLAEAKLQAEHHEELHTKAARALEQAESKQVAADQAPTGNAAPSGREEELAAELDAVREELERARADAAAHRAAEQALQGTVDALEREVDSTREALAQYAHLNAEAERAQDLQAVLENQRAAYAAMQADMQARLDRAAGQLGDAQAAVEQQRALVHELREELDTAQSRVHELGSVEEDLASVRSALAAAEARAAAHLNEGAQEADQLRAELAAAKQREQELLAEFDRERVELRETIKRKVEDFREHSRAQAAELLEKQNTRHKAKLVAQRREVLDALQSAASQHGVQLEVSDESNVPSVCGAFAAELQARYEHMGAELHSLRQKESGMQAQQAAMVQQAEQQYQQLMSQFTKLQSNCRDALRREENLREQLARMEGNNKKMYEEKRELLSRIELLQQGQHSAVAAERANLEQMQRELEVLQAELAQREETIASLHLDAEQRVRDRLQRDSAHESEVAMLRAQLDEDEATVEALRERVAQLEAGTDEQTDGLRQEMQALREKNRELELDAAASQSLMADFKRVQAELKARTDEAARASEALNNLQLVLEQFQTEQAAERDAIEVEREQMADDLERGRQAVAEAEAMRGKLEAQAEQQAALDEQVSGLQEYVLKLERENGKARRALEETVQHLRSTDENMVDRRLVVKMLTNYFRTSGGQRHEVLRVMTGVLGCSAEERSAILGTQSLTGRIGQFARFLLTSQDEDEEVGSAEDGSKLGADLEGKNLADMWVDFLLSKTESMDGEEASLAQQQEEALHRFDTPDSSPAAGVRGGGAHAGFGFSGAEAAPVAEAVPAPVPASAPSTPAQKAFPPTQFTRPSTGGFARPGDS